MKRHYVVRLLMWLLITTNTVAQIVEIPDPNLRQAVRADLQLPDGSPVTQREMLRLDELTAGGLGITDLTGLEFATNLVFLHLEANRITDLTPLANLIALEYLWLGHNFIVDISPLANLTKLKDLRLSDNLIKNVVPLANLTSLETLWITENVVADFSPIQGLSISDLRYDELCVLPDLPIQERIENRSLPSIVSAWADGLAHGDVWDNWPGLSHLSIADRIAYHDLAWHGGSNLFSVNFVKGPPWTQLSGSIEHGIADRNKLLAKNPNMLFLAHQLSRYSKPGSLFPEDWFGWLRDEAGNPVPVAPNSPTYLIDLSNPEVQDIIVEQAVSVSKCGVYDGILYDTWRETIFATDILKRIRDKVPDDFLIIINRNGHKLPLSIPYINGSFMETFYNEDDEGVYTRNDIIKIETNLIWFETNAREPQINVLRGFGIGDEPPNSPNNRRWMRLFTTMSLTVSDGYVLYSIGTVGGQKQFQSHIWYPFWDANLGQPISPTAQRYQDIEGLYIREFTNGWAVYNRTGKEQAITLPRVSMGVSSNKQDITHLLPDLDGEIYLRVGKPFDLNRDGTVDVLDLIIVSQAFGTTEGDVNGDGNTNILDLVLVAQQFSQ